jgi:hypothetical protein
VPGPVVLVTANVRTGGGAPCRSAVRHESRPCDAVQAYRL